MNSVPSHPPYALRLPLGRLRPRIRTKVTTTTTSGLPGSSSRDASTRASAAAKQPIGGISRPAAADFDRAAELGLNSIRLSVEWSRIEPEPGVFDASALRQYAEMLRLLRQRGLEPMVTLHHFTDPLWLAEIGGWENPLVEDYFSRYTARVVEALGDQVTLWCTINEPLVYAVVGYLDGRFPPGVKSLRRAMNVLRRMLLAHGRAYRTIHRLQNDARAGLAHHMRVHLPANPASAADRRAPRP